MQCLCVASVLHYIVHIALIERSRDTVKSIKVFISQPMRDKTDEQIIEERQHAINIIKKKYGKDVEILDSFFKGAPHESTPIWFLGKSLEVLSQADLAYFIGDWEKYRGCKIENIVAHEYGIDTIEE